MALLTFEEFERLADPPEGRYELVRGELITVPPPRKGHKRIQMPLERWLLRRLSTSWECTSELGVRIGAGSYLIPDVAIISRDRWERTPEAGYVEGAPELAIEIISPSNTASEIDDKVSLYMEHSARECWIIDPAKHRITVYAIDQPRRSYSVNDAISRTRFGIAEPLPVSVIFAD